MFRAEYPFLTFAQLAYFELDHGVPDQLWRTQEAPERMPLFAEDNGDL